ncbi:unnamed protein product [Cylicostephanus goldi]|uniref:Heterogeneous nuclear ribonucleoprotein L RRM domain-containing protein n=1 Tax=Cylicostephanus goldi TaxID=71465 RepID=A0A3P6RCW4_CYLGO|nr:unnamed protein product [Cylicostephanus goldi]
METVEQANEALALVNHTPVVSPLGKTPYIVKLAYATPSRRHGDATEEGGGDGTTHPPRAVSGTVIGEGEVVTEDHIKNTRRDSRDAYVVPST